LMSKASVLNVCGMFTAREFQTRRADVAKSMEDTVREDLEKLGLDAGLVAQPAQHRTP